MSRRMSVVASMMIAAAFAAGVVVAKKNPTSPDLFLGKDPKAAGDALLGMAREYAGDGSWENIATARVYYLSGRKEEGQKIMDVAIAKKAAPGDWIRIGRVYWEAGDWQKAQAAFDKVLQMAPADADWLAEIGAYYLVKGDRKHAEELFQRSLTADPDNQRNVLRMAGAYLGLMPHE